MYSIKEDGTLFIMKMPIIHTDQDLSDIVDEIGQIAKLHNGDVEISVIDGR